jgi:uncharacterized protein YhhL (DUF1145 family)
VEEDLSMYVNILAIFEPFEQILSFIQRLSITVRVSVSKIDLLIWPFNIVELVSPLDQPLSILAVELIIHFAVHSLPLHIGSRSVNRSQSSLVETALVTHVSDGKEKFFLLDHALHTEVKPSLVMAFRVMGHAICRHVNV